MAKKIELSIVIVAYKAQEAVARCLKSIGSSETTEIIVIDNTHNNRGFSAACNLGALQARGTYILFLNPDCVVMDGSIKTLHKKIESDASIGIIAPQLLSLNKKPYRSYSMQPRWYSFLLLNSFLKDFLPVSLHAILDPYYNDSLTETKSVEAVSGAALLISKEIFTIIGGFSTDYFLFWEDFDICQKVLQINKKILYYPKAQIIHSGGGSSTEKKAVQKLFQQSRFIYMKNNFGYLYAVIAEMLLRVSEAI